LYALMRVLNKDEFRLSFAEKDGLQLLGGVLKAKMKSLQILYEVAHCMWLLTYNKSVAERVADTNVIRQLTEVLRTQTKEKVIRMCYATFRNLVNIGSNNEVMLDVGTLRPIELARTKTWGDEDIKEDLDFISDSLQKNLVELSSFDIFKRQLSSGALEWTPVHKSEKFWRENAHRLEEDNSKLLLILKDLLTNSKDPVVQAIACFDIGEFARFHPRGKILIAQHEVKLPLMSLMESPDKEVKKNALLAVQKMLVTNWEYLNA